MKTKYGSPFFLGILGIILTVFCLNAAPNYVENPRINVYLIEEVSFTQPSVSPADLWQTAKKTLGDLDYPLTGETKGEGKEAVMVSRIRHQIISTYQQGPGEFSISKTFPGHEYDYYLIITQKPQANTLNIKMVKTYGSFFDTIKFPEKIGIRALKKYLNALKANFQ